MNGKELLLTLDSRKRTNSNASKSFRSELEWKKERRLVLKFEMQKMNVSHVFE